MSDSYQKAQSLLSSTLGKLRKSVTADGTQMGQAPPIGKSRYGGNNTGTIYGENVDTQGNAPPQLQQVGTSTKKSVGSNPFAS